MAKVAAVLAPSVDVDRRARFGRVAGQEVRVYSGSAKGRCWNCGHPVWVGPRSRVAADAGEVVPACETCIGNAMEAGWRPAVIGSFENPEGGRSRAR